VVEILFHALETAGSGCLFPVSTTIIAAIIDAVPRVAMNELTLSFTTIKPFTKPINAATKIVTKIARGRGRPLAMPSSFLPFMSLITRRVLKFMFAATDKSNVPHESGIINDNASIAEIDLSEATERNVAKLKNRSGIQIENPTINNAKM
jgi:hypothetical protein